MWRILLKNMPIAILVDVCSSYYNVRDNTLKIAWANDLPEGGYSELLYEIADALPTRDIASFRKALSCSD